ncbi:MAG: hypothetical protein JWN25_2545 [Verrucomicrobiales bacterium]|nr:hypothetical protein [Verrucomicrobiales bacterium]
MKTPSPALEKLKKLRTSVLAEQKAKTEKTLAMDVETKVMPSHNSESTAKQSRVSSSIESEPPVVEPPVQSKPSVNKSIDHSEKVVQQKKPANLSTPSTPTEVTFSSHVLSQLDSHLTDGSTWTRASIIEELIRNHVDAVYPEICYRGEIIAPANIFCVIDRFSFRPALRIRSAVGEFKVLPRENNESLEKWRITYQNRGEPNAEKKAQEMCIFELYQQLIQYTGPSTSHVIYPEDFLVETCFA